MNTRSHLKITLTTLILLTSSTIILAQDEPPAAASKASGPMTPGTFVDENGNVTVVTSGTPISKSFIDANGNGTMSVFTNGVQQDYIVTPDGTYAAGSAAAPSAGQSTDAQALERARQLASDALRNVLGCTNTEWAIIWPKIQKIQLLQAAIQPGARMVPTGSSAQVPPSVVEVRTMAQELQKLLNKDAADAQVTNALASLRDARAKVKTELVQARKELTDLVTHRQEAILFNKGILAD